MLSRITLSPNDASSLLREHRARNLWGLGVETVFKGPAPHGGEVARRGTGTH